MSDSTMSGSTVTKATYSVMTRGLYQNPNRIMHPISNEKIKEAVDMFYGDCRASINEFYSDVDEIHSDCEEGTNLSGLMVRDIKEKYWVLKINYKTHVTDLKIRIGLPGMTLTGENRSLRRPVLDLFELVGVHLNQTRKAIWDVEHDDVNPWHPEYDDCMGRLLEQLQDYHDEFPGDFETFQGVVDYDEDSDENSDEES